MMRDKLFLLSLGFGALWIASCGKPVCVAGVGDCAAFGQPVVPQTGSMTASLSSSSVHSGQQVTVTFSGGKPPYMIESAKDQTKTYGYFKDPTNLSNTEWKISTSSTTATYYATSNLLSSTNTNIPLTVSDSSVPTLYVTVTVQVLGP